MISGRFTNKNPSEYTQIDSLSLVLKSIVKNSTLSHNQMADQRRALVLLYTVCSLSEAAALPGEGHILVCREASLFEYPV